MSFIRNLDKYTAFIKECRKRNLPLFETYRLSRKLKREKGVTTAFTVTTKWIYNNRKDTFYLHSDYIDRCLKLYTQEVRELFLDKTVLWERCPDFLGRKCIDLTKASEEESFNFIDEHKKIIGKGNFGWGSANIDVYERGNKSAFELLKIIKNRGQTLLEEYIQQHDLLSVLYPGAVNTLRIHTVNNGVEIRSYIKPKMRVGCNGSFTDIGGNDGAYKVILNEDGSIDIAVYHDKCNFIHETDEHCNTKVKFADLQVPYVQEAIDLVKKAAERFPEASFIGWDVAITSNGPVIVEANDISGAFNTYQMISYIQRGVGMKKEIDEMLSFAENRK